MNQPVTPAMTATIVPASSALTMNGYVNSCRKSSSRFHDRPWKTAASSMAVAVMEGRLGLAADDEPPVRGVQHLDRHAEEPRQRLARDHISRPAADRAAAGDIDDLVDEAEDRVDVVRDEQDGDVLLLADPAHERGDRGLAREVEAVERLVQQEQLRAADERLGNQQPLLLATGELPDPLPRVAARTRQLAPPRGPGRPLPRRRGAPGRAAPDG